MANNLLLLRQYSKATPKQLSRLLNISVHTYYYYEKGRMDIPYEIIMLLSLIYRIPAEYVSHDGLEANEDVLDAVRVLAQLDDAERYKRMICNLMQSNQSQITYRQVRKIKDTFRTAHRTPDSGTFVHTGNPLSHPEDE